MINVRVQELEAIADILNKELQMHEAWRDQIHRTLVCRLTPSPADLAEDAHQCCEFGKWFYSAQNAALRALPVFKNIEKLHEAMHDEARSLCTIIKNNWVITPNEYDPFLRALQQFRCELHQIRGRVFETLRKIDAQTGVFCGTELAEDLALLARQQQERGRPCSLLRLRFDLREINERQGWETGDRVLNTCLGKVKAALADQDRIYRHTGADFIICLPGKAPSHVEQIKDLLLRVIAEAQEQALLISDALTGKGADKESPDDALPSAPDQPEPEPTAATAKPTLTVQYAILPLLPDANIDDLIKQTSLTSQEILS